MKKLLTILMLTFLTSQLSASMIICNINLSQEISCYWSAGDCTTKAPGIDYCFNVDPWTGALSQGRAVVFIDDESNGAVQIGDKIVNILPDFLDSLIRTNKLNEINNVQPTKISTKVSKKRFEEIAKELGVQVTKVKKLPKANYCPACEEVEKKKKAQDKVTINPFESVIIEMVCDCNPSLVLNTFVTDAKGGVNIVVPKDANYSFKIVFPPIIREKGIKMAALANDVVVNFKGPKNIENLSFNNKGVASAKNLQQGNYEIALNRKPPKGGPKGPPPSRKCPPGEIPWCGGCIPADVVNKVKKPCPDGYILVLGVCGKVDERREGPDLVPKGAKLPPAIAINCPSGKYDANGNCIFASPITTDNQSKMFSVFSVDAGYLGSANSTNNKESKPLFAGSGLSAGLNYRYGAKWGITGRVGYAGGSRSQSNLNEFASTLTKTPWVYKITGYTKTWSQVNFAAGPSIFLGKNYKGEISVVGGVSMGSESKLKIDLYDVNTFYKNVYDVTEKKVKAFWEIGGSYRVLAAKRMTLGLKASYGANGGTIGINITSFCIPCCCQKHDPNCCANMPKSSKIIEN